MAERENAVTKPYLFAKQGKASTLFVCVNKNDVVQLIYVDNSKAKEVEVDQTKKTLTFSAEWQESFKPVEFMSGVSVLRIK